MPMFNQGSAEVRLEPDGWTVATRDGKLSAQFEHTVAVNKAGFSVLTLRPEEMPMLAACRSSKQFRLGRSGSTRYAGARSPTGRGRRYGLLT